jgi:hypothetical protein
MGERAAERVSSAVNTNEVFGIMASIVTLAMLSVVVVNGGNVAKILDAGGNTFVKSIEAATGKAI